MITSQVQFQIAKFKFRQYQNTTFFRPFAKFNARQIFPLCGTNLETVNSEVNYEVFKIFPYFQLFVLCNWPTLIIATSRNNMDSQLVH